MSDNTRKVKAIRIREGRKGAESLEPGEVTQLRSITGSLSWIARQGRPDLLYQVSSLQTGVRNATVATLIEANKVVELAMRRINDVWLIFPVAWIEWKTQSVQ